LEETGETAVLTIVQRRTGTKKLQEIQRGGGRKGAEKGGLDCTGPPEEGKKTKPRGQDPLYSKKRDLKKRKTGS